MQYIEIVFKMFICLFEVFMVIDFFEGLYERKHLYKYNKFIELIPFSISIFIINIFESSILNIIVVPLIYFLINILLFEGKLYEKIFSTIIANVIIIGAEFIVVIVLNVSAEEIIESSIKSDEIVILLSLVVKLVTFLIFQIVKRFGSKKDLNMDLKLFVSYLIIPTATIGLILSNAYTHNNLKDNRQIIWILLFGILVLGNILIFYQFNLYAKTVKNEEETKTNYIRQQMELEGYKKLERANRRYKKLIHDTNHYVKNIFNLIENNEVEKAKTILREVTQDYEQLEIVEYSGNKILNVILSDYNRRAIENNIDFKIFVEKGLKIESIKEIDIISMFSNLLANAFEAVEQVKEKEVNLKVFMVNDGNFLVVKLENSYNGKLLIERNGLASTKENKELHGNGIKNIQELALKYNGYIDTSWNSNKFTSVLMLEII